MSTLSILDTAIKRQSARYPEGLTDDEIFEFYCADNILVNFDLDNGEIEKGLIDGPRDAGVDAAYVFINGQLLTEEMNLEKIRKPIILELYLIQSKNEKTFKEGPLDKLSSSLMILLDHAEIFKEAKSSFKKEIHKICRSFIEAREKLSHEFPKTHIRVFYCCKGSKQSNVVQTKSKSLEKQLAKFQFQEVQVTLLGAQDLYDRSAMPKKLVLELPTSGTPISGENSYIALCKLRNYLHFISDEGGNLRARIFAANVRAYQGGVSVNLEISNSIEHPTPGVDFWWLNNGVTIVADDANYQNNRLIISNPLIVNGLQTSHEIHAFASKFSDDDQRDILIRIVVEKESLKRDQIIRATNRQTGMKNSSFRATEKIHRELEDFLSAQGYFYDRRKNLYKHEGKPAAKIIGIDLLAQAVLSLLLQEPHTARARPASAISVDSNYKRIFSGKSTVQPLAMYGATVEMLIRVEKHFRALPKGTDRIYRNNLKFHSLMVLGWTLNGGKTLPALRIQHLDLRKITDKQVKAVVDWVRSEFDMAGAEDKTAKDSAFTERLKRNWTAAATLSKASST